MSKFYFNQPESFVFRPIVIMPKEEQTKLTSLHDEPIYKEEKKQKTVCDFYHVLLAVMATLFLSVVVVVSLIVLKSPSHTIKTQNMVLFTISF